MVLFRASGFSEFLNGRIQLTYFMVPVFIPIEEGIDAGEIFPVQIPASG